MNGRVWFALLSLFAAIVPVSIAADLLVWPVDDTMGGPLCGINWIGVIPLGGYCA